MDIAIFKKMRAKQQCTAAVFYAPDGYPKWPEMIWGGDGQADFVHLFIESRQQFEERFPQAAKAHKDAGLFWVSYPKSRGKIKYDINRDSLWELLLSVGFHPVSQVSLNEDWSAVRIKKNEEGVVYERPGNVKR
ncbi:MAG: hypothetical protein FWC76_04455 [Defluviitaleaceae bacterium]|nr:hypothetical protein [Defluviitaleaceae bacterium]